MQEPLKLKASNWDAETTERSRGRMKVTFKLSKEEAQSFKNWSDVVRPEGVDDDQFLKTIFFHGISALNEQLQKIAEQEKNRILAAEKLKEQKESEPKA